ALNKQALRKTAEKAQEHGVFNMDIHSQTVLALLDELEKMQAQSSKWCEAFHKAVSVGARYEERIAELEARAFNPAILDVIAERQRQQSVEGWMPEHDDQYSKSQLLWASSCYVLNAIHTFNRIPFGWPWTPEWWKPTNPRRDLVKAGALILAEIERIDRQEAAQ
ncbi:ead/Ea22-like family protein, partial [Escherichia coli]